MFTYHITKFTNKSITIYYSPVTRSICFFQFFSSHSFAARKWPHHKNHWCAESGDGCGASRIRCFVVSINVFFDLAKFPRKRKTRWSWCCDKRWMTLSVNSSRQSLWCDAASCAFTVRIAFSNKTHCSARLVKFPFWRFVQYSAWSSFAMFFKDGGMGTPSGTEKLSPCACPSPWYGSCHNITTFTVSNGVASNARKKSEPAGKICSHWNVRCFNSVINAWKYGFSNSSHTISYQSAGNWTIIFCKQVKTTFGDTTSNYPNRYEPFFASFLLVMQIMELINIVQ